MLDCQFPPFVLHIDFQLHKLQQEAEAEDVQPPPFKQASEPMVSV